MSEFARATPEPLLAVIVLKELLNDVDESLGSDAAKGREG
jgi:hypothetical protein